MNVEVTSVSKKEQKLSEVAAAIFVITPEDIRRSGATGIPDVLRMVPGLDAAQINANPWAISARGFNFQFENKLLVLIDGRAVYTPLFGGVNRDTQDVPLEDIERIEVIRGPGGTIWGPMRSMASLTSSRKRPRIHPECSWLREAARTSRDSEQRSMAARSETEKNTEFSRSI